MQQQQFKKLCIFVLISSTFGMMFDTCSSADNSSIITTNQTQATNATVADTANNKRVNSVTTHDIGEPQRVSMQRLANNSSPSRARSYKGNKSTTTTPSSTSITQQGSTVTPTTVIDESKPKTTSTPTTTGGPATMKNDEFFIGCRFPELWLIDCSHSHLSNEYLPDFSTVLRSGRNEITHLNLSYNNLDRLDGEFWSMVGELFNLTHLDLSHNRIRSIEMEPSSRALTLTSLNLSHNKLQTISDNGGALLRGIRTVALDNNPWHCACNPTWMSSLATQTTSTVRCETPNEYKELDFRNLIERLPACDSALTVGNRILFLLSSMALIMAAFAVGFLARSVIHDRFFGPNQYGTVYYTKTDFSNVDNQL